MSVNCCISATLRRKSSFERKLRSCGEVESFIIRSQRIARRNLAGLIPAANGRITLGLRRTMTALKGFTKLPTVIAVAASLAASGAAASDIPQRQPVCQAGILTDASTGSPLFDKYKEPIRCESVCRGGILTDASTGRPVFDPTKKDPEPIRCGPPPEEWDPALVGVGVLAAAGAAVGGCAAAGCFTGPSSPPVFPPVPPATP